RMSNVTVPEATERMRAAKVRGDTLEIEAELTPENAQEIGFRLRVGKNEETDLGFIPDKKEVFIDRARSGDVSFAPEFPGRQIAAVQQNSRVRLHVFLDRSSVEVFVNDGEAVLTDRIYPSPGSDGIELYSDSGRGKVLSLSIWKLGSIWR
ncbi:MAG: GH32 C-terminal domain-containing protein, partial [Candidatus Acidiferrum sp.]